MLTTPHLVPASTAGLIELGAIHALQVQRGRLKLGEKPNRFYDPAALLAVSELTITPQGVIGRTETGERILDVHNASHPESRQLVDGSNAVSLGFTGHYARMHERFGGHIPLGAGGETLIVETARRVRREDLREGFGVWLSAQERLIWFEQVVVAEPCKPFSAYCLGLAPGERVAPDIIQATLQFLSQGLRGYYTRLPAGEAEAVVRVGDRLYLPALGEG